MMLPRWDSVAALYCLTKSMMLTPCGPSAVPTGGAGVAAPALSWTLTTAAILFFLGAICLPCVVVPGPPSDLADLVERELHRGLAAEDRHEHLELLGVGVELAHGSGKRRERALHHRNGLVDLEVHRGRPHGLRLLRGLLLRHRGEQRGDLVQRQRRRLARQPDEACDAGGVADHGPGLVGQL